MAVCACAQTKAPPPASPAAAGGAAQLGAAGPAQGAPFRLVPAGEARASLLAAISISSLDRLLGAGTALVGRAVPLPLDPIGVRDMLLSQAGLSPAVGENLDFASPAGAAVVAFAPNTNAGLVMALPAKGVAEGQRVIDALGKVVGRHGAALQIDNGAGGTGWLWQSGTALVLSDSLPALERGAMLALEARRAGTEDVTAVLFPDAIARARNTDVKTALAKMLDQARAGAATTQAGNSYVDLAVLAGYVADAATVELGLQVDTSRGLSMRCRLNAKPGSSLEALANKTTPFFLDPALFAGGSELAFLFASSGGPFVREQMIRNRTRLERSPDRAAVAALKFYDAFVAATTGGISAAGRTRPHLAAQMIYPLRDAAAAEKLSAELGRLNRPAALAWWNAQFGSQSASMFDWVVKKETVGRLKAVRYTLVMNPKLATPQLRDSVKTIMGGNIDTYAAVVGDRLVMTFGKDARAQLQAIAGGKKGMPTGEVAQAIAAVQGRDGFMYMDVGPVLKLVAALSDDPRAAMFANSQASIPLYGSGASDGAGKVVTFELTIPPAAFAGAGAIMQSFGGVKAR